MSKAYVKAAAAYLQSVPLLAKLSKEEREQLAQALKTKTFKDGSNIITQGDSATAFYIILKGTVSVIKDDVEMCQLTDGDYFGETALLTTNNRAATVKALGTVDVFFMEVTKFQEMFGNKKLNVAFAHRIAVSAESADVSRQSTAGSYIVKPADKHKTAAQASLISTAINTCILFYDLNKQQQEAVVEAMHKEEVKSGSMLIKEGEKGNKVYVVEEGTFDIVVKGNKVATREAGNVFGELALMYNAPRAASVVATSDATLWVLDRVTFRRLVTSGGQKRYQQYCDFLQKVELLAPLHNYEREAIAEALEEDRVTAGTVVFKQGDEGDFMYIVKSGELVVQKDGKEVMRLSPGQYFGELALLKNEPRAASVVASTNAELLRLDRNAFNLLLGPLQEVLDQGAKAYTDAESKLADLSLDDKTDKSIKFENLKSLGTLGKGSFGHVRLVQDVTTGKTYALKAVNKKQIAETGQQGHVLNEKRCMAAMDSPFLIRLYATFKDKDRLYFLLEPILGGELFTILRSATLFDEDTARYYAASVVLAFEYMHERNIIYRDLKPENLLVDADGSLKVTDFGFAKRLPPGSRTWTLCGTPDYLAPEIVAGKGHGKGVDWWTLGILIFEMLASYPPFYDEDPMNTYRKILKGKVQYPSHFSRDAISIIKQLLNPKSTKRLGVVKGGAKLIKMHPWFKKMDWKKLEAKKLNAPIIPKISSSTDLSNFAPEDDRENIPAYKDDGTNWDADF